MARADRLRGRTWPQRCRDAKAAADGELRAARAAVEEREAEALKAREDGKLVAASLRASGVRIREARTGASKRRALRATATAQAGAASGRDAFADWPGGRGSWQTSTGTRARTGLKLG